LAAFFAAGLADFFGMGVLSAVEGTVLSVVAEYTRRGALL